MYEHGFLYVPGSPLCFLVNDIEALWAEGVSCRTAVMVDKRGGLEVFFDSISQCLA